MARLPTGSARVSTSCFICAWLGLTWLAGIITTSCQFRAGMAAAARYWVQKSLSEWLCLPLKTSLDKCLTWCVVDNSEQAMVVPLFPEHIQVLVYLWQ